LVGREKNKKENKTQSRKYEVFSSGADLGAFFGFSSAMDRQTAQDGSIRRTQGNHQTTNNYK